MKYTKRFTLSLFIVIWTVAGGLMTASEFPVESGTHRLVMKMENGETLRYALFIPEGYKADTATPLVMALHYGGEVTPYYGQGYLDVLVKPAFKDLGALIVAPDCPGRGWGNDKAEKAVLALMDLIEKKYSIDKRRTLLTGFSMGGMGTWYLAPRHPKRFRLAIPVAAVSDPDSLAKFQKTPIYIINSDKDEHFPIKDVEKMVKQLMERKVPVTFKVLSGISHYSTHKFAPALRDTIPWIKNQWAEGS